jgi:hypothetical protein
MSFWNNKPGPTFKHYLKSLFCGPKEPELLGAPVVEPFAQKWHIRRAAPADVPQICKFWKDHFRRPSSPVTVYDPKLLAEQIANQGFILLVCCMPQGQQIFGTIMSQPLGPIKRLGVSRDWSSFNVRWIDMFCVHYSKWRQGLGSALLNQLYREHAAIGDHACIFMKEGSALPMPALRSSEYVFRYVMDSSRSQSRDVEEWTPDQFITFAQTLPGKTNYFIHQRPGSRSKIFAYNGFNGTIAAVFVLGHEVHYEDRNPIVWCSGIVRSGQLMDAEEIEASKRLSEAASAAFNSPWIWMDGAQLRFGPEWIKDGPYHIYGFHMDTGIYMKAEPVLIL